MFIRLFCAFILIGIQAMAQDCYPPPKAPNLVQVCDNPKIYVIENFLTAAECDYIISQATPRLERSNVVDDSGADQDIVHDDRTSQGMFFEQFPKDSILEGIQARISAITAIPLDRSENMQVLHYGPGQEFKPHHDYFDVSSVGGQQCLNRGGQRIATFMVYLHSTPEGGETVFPEANLEIKPVKGKAVLFYNCLPDGKENARSLHGGAPVLKGEKWIITKWFRTELFQ